MTTKIIFFRLHVKDELKVRKFSVRNINNRVKKKKIGERLDVWN